MSSVHFFHNSSAITITSHKRIAPYLAEEVKALGYAVDEVFVTGVKMQGTITDCIRLNLHLRCASQVLYSIKTFKAENADDVYKAVSELDWQNILPENGYFSVTSNVLNDTINNRMYANLRVKDAIVDTIRRHTGVRPDTGSELKGTVVHLFWKNEHAELFLDTSGDSLARHGYRKIPGLAPMLEGLAAATIYATNWDRKTPFINPMCGSGTLAIEAALIATNKVPGLFRTNYAFMHLRGYNEALYNTARKEIEEQIIEVPGLRIIATDNNPRAIENTELNAIAAGVDDVLRCKVCDFTQTSVPEGGRGVMMINPEYGERLGDVEALEKTYAQIGDFMKQRCKGYTGYVFTGNMELAKKIGLKARRRYEFYNSKIDCRLLEYELYDGTRREMK